MGQFFGKETLKNLEIASATTLSLPSGSRIRIGGQAYSFNDPLTLDLATDIDTGAVAADTTYYVYAVFASETLSLKYSLSIDEPAGFNAFRLIGILLTNDSSEIRRVQNSLDGLIPLAEKSPVGAIISLGKDTIPEGYLYCNGQAVSRATYAELFSEIGVTHGEGDGSTTFNVPDLRGNFLRGQDDSAGRDPDVGSRTAPNTGGATGDSVGSVQNKAFDSHQHNFRSSNFSGFAGGTYTWTTATNGRNDRPNPQTTTNSIQGSGGSETRPINVNVKYAIKY